MKKKLVFLFILFMIIIPLCMCGTSDEKKNNNGISVYDENITLHNMSYDEESNIYNIDYQKNLYNEIESLKKKDKFTLEDPLVIINPFETNTSGIYIYFTTDVKSYVEYEISVNDETIHDFSEILNNDEKNNLTKEHEYVLIGGVAGKENTITLNLYNKNSEMISTKTFKVSIPELDPGSDSILTVEDGTSTAELSDGLFATLGHINNENKNNNTYYYDNEGICRAQIKLDGYRIDRMVFENNLMYISVNTNKIAALDRLGYVEKVYDLGKYEMHHDFIYDNNGNLLVLASDTESNSIEDRVISLNLKNGKVEEIIDFGTLFPEMKEKAVLPKDKDKLDWIHVNSIELLDDKTALFSSRELSTIIAVENIYNNPTTKYLIGDEEMWINTPYTDKILTKEGDFSIHGGQHSINVVKNDDLGKGQYYIYFFNNNTGVSTHYPDYDWSKVANIDTDSMYYKYLVDENSRTYSLEKEIKLLPSRYISSVQEYKGHLIADSGNSETIYEFDSSDELIRKYTLKEKMWGLYRCFKYDFNDFYFHKIQ